MADASENERKTANVGNGNTVRNGTGTVKGQTNRDGTRRVPLRDPDAAKKKAQAQKLAAEAARKAEAEKAARLERAAKDRAVRHKRKADRIVTAVFAGWIFVVGILALVLPKPTFSESEKRELAKKPSFTADEVFGGDYTDDFDRWYSDTFPARDFLVGLAARVKDLRGLRIFGKGGATIYSQSDDGYATSENTAEIDESKFTDGETIVIGEVSEGTIPDDYVPGTIPQESDTALPPAEDGAPGGDSAAPSPTHAEGSEGPAGEKRGSLYVVGDTALELYRGNEETAKVYAEAVNTYAKYLPENVRIYDLVVPTHTEFRLPRSDRGVSNEQRPVLSAIAENLSDRVTFIDAYDSIWHHYEAGEYLYFRTDHHWTGLGAYYAYEQFCRKAGFEAVPLANYESGRIEPFLGTFYQSSRDAALKAAPDYVEYYLVDTPCKVTRYDKDGNAFGAKLVYTAVNGEGNAYLAFLGGDFPYMKAVRETETVYTAEDGTTETVSSATGRKLIVFKESYGNALIPFLAPHYDEIHIADIRTFPYNAVNFINQYGITDVLFVNGLMSASTGARVDDLYAMLNK